MNIGDLFSAYDVRKIFDDAGAKYVVGKCGSCPLRISASNKCTLEADYGIVISKCARAIGDNKIVAANEEQVKKIINELDSIASIHRVHT